MKNKYPLMSPDTESNGSTTMTQSPASNGSSGNDNSGSSSGPKNNPWAEETVRQTSQGEQPVKPIVQPKPVVTPPTPKPVTPPVQPQTQPPVQQQPPVQTETPAQPLVQNPPAQTGQSIDPKALAQAFAQELRNVQPQQTNESQQTPEQQEAAFNRQFSVVNLTADDFTAIVGFAPEKPEQVAALNQTLQRLNVQSVKMANYMAEQKIKALEEKLSSQLRPVVQQTREQQDRAIEDAFFQTYPGLQDHRPLLMEIRELLEAQHAAGKIKFTKPEEVINFVAEKASKLLGRPVEDFKRPATQPTGGGTQAPQQQTATPRQMTTASTGGRVGSGSSATSSKGRKTTAEALFSEEGA